MYMTPPEGQGFEAHFDWMDGIVVQLAGSKTWILYDEIMAAPRPDLKFKPAATELGEPIAVLELHPGDLMYIPRGWPHEAAVNGTKKTDAGRSRGAREPSVHITFGIESALSGTYESLLHHALQVAAAEHPDLFGLSHERVDEGAASTSATEGEGKGEKPIFPWLQLLHLSLHDAASRDKRLRKAVPLAPIFSPPSLPPTPDDNTPTGASDDDTSRVCASDAAAPAAPTPPPPAAILKEFRQALEAFSVVSSSADDESTTSSLLESLSDEHKVERVLGMFQVQASGDDEGEGDGRRAAEAFFSAGVDRGEGSRFSWAEGWDRATLEAFDLASFPASLKAKLGGFLKVASVEGAVERMVAAATTRARERAAMTERDLARCGQGERE